MRHDGKRKIKSIGGATYIAKKIDEKHASQRCIRMGKVCAFRIKMTGTKHHQSYTSACGYCLYTGNTRGNVIRFEGENHIEYEEGCTKWAEELPDTVLVTNIEEEDCDYECET